jgi:hypothetical protein
MRLCRHQQRRCLSSSSSCYPLSHSINCCLYQEDACELRHTPADPDKSSTDVTALACLLLPASCSCVAVNKTNNVLLRSIP